MKTPITDKNTGSQMFTIYWCELHQMSAAAHVTRQSYTTSVR